MKKTLVALAVMAATGASFAQVTVSGTIASGFKDTISADGAQSRNAGFGVDTAEINFTAKEDIGGGQTIEAKFGLANMSRGAIPTPLPGEAESTGFGPGDLTLTYTNTSVGRIQLGTERGAALMAGIPSAGAPVIDMDGKIYQLRSSSDFISYAAPIGPVIVAFKHSEGSNVKGLGAGMSGPAGAGLGQLGQRTNDLAVVYKQDALELVGVYRSYDNRDPVSMTTGNSLTKDSAIVLQAGYDFGFAKVGFGYNGVTASASPVKLTDMMIGVSAPMGPLTVGATLGREVVSGVGEVASSYFEAAAMPALFRTNAGVSVRGALALADGTANSMSLGAKYDLSKRTSLTVNYARWTRSGYAQFEAVGATTLAAAAQASIATQIGAMAGANPLSSGAAVTAALNTAAGLAAFNAAPVANTFAQKGNAAVAAASTAAVTAMLTPGSNVSQFVVTQGTVGSATDGINATVNTLASAGASNAAITAPLTISAANNAAIAASSMGYKADGSEFNILLTYAF